VARVPPPGAEEAFYLTFAASASQIALLDGDSSCGKGGGCYEDQQLSIGPLGGALGGPGPGCPARISYLRLFSGTEEGLAPLETTAVAVDGDVVAYDSFDCLVVEDRAAGLRRVIALPSLLDAVRTGGPKYEVIGGGWESRLLVAGRLVAYRENTLAPSAGAAVAVYDIDSAQVLYRVVLPPIADGSGPLAGPTFGLQADGTLVVADAASCTASVSSIANPQPRPLGIPACAVRGVRGVRALLVVPASAGHRALAWTSLTEPAAHTIADLGVVGALEATRSQLGDDEAAYALAGCRAASIYRTPLAEPGSPPTPPSECPLRVRHATLTAHGMELQARCPSGCKGVIRESLGTAKRLRAHKGWELTTGAEFSIAPGQTKDLSLLRAQATWLHITASTLAAQWRHVRGLKLRVEWETETPYAEAGEGLSAPKSSPGVAPIITRIRRHAIVPVLER
jgi:hypothetical protein